MLFQRYGNLAMGIFFMVASIVYYFMADTLPKSTLMKIGPDFMPKIVAAATFAISTALFVLSLHSLRKSSAAPAQSDTATSEYGRVLLTILAFALYVIFYESVGFPVMTFIYLVLQMIIFAPRGNRNIPLFVAISLVASLAIFFTFRNGLDVLLPPGILRGMIN